MFLIWGVTFGLVWEGIRRLFKPESVDGKLMFIMGSFGLFVNIVMGVILYQSGYSGHGHSHGQPLEELSKSNSVNRTTEVKDEYQSLISSGPVPAKPARLYINVVNPAAGDQASTDNASTRLIDSESPSNASPNSAHKKDHHHHSTNINVRSAFIHVIGDALQNAGVMIAAGVLWADSRYTWVDPLCTFIFSILVVFTTVRITKQCVAILMERAPDRVDSDKLEVELKGLRGVRNVSDVHVWSVGMEMVFCMAHIVVEDDTREDVLQQAHSLLKNKYQFQHSTVQIERAADKLD